MKRIVLLRHGQSIWNKENRFTGWTDVDLTEEGVAEAARAGELLRDEGFAFGMAYTSYLKRAVRTLDCVLDRLNQAWIPVEKSWRLNEKHYGMLQGLNKSETAAQYGDEQVHIWRRSYDIAPDPLPDDDPRNPRFDARYACVPDAELPRTESLAQTIARIMPYWHCVVFPSLMRYDNLLVVAHGNSLRGVIKHLKHIPDDEIAALNLPTAPLRLRIRRHAAPRARPLPRRPRRDSPPRRGRSPVRAAPADEKRRPDFREIRPPSSAAAITLRRQSAARQPRHARRAPAGSTVSRRPPSTVTRPSTTTVSTSEALAQ